MRKQSCSRQKAHTSHLMQVPVGLLYAPIQGFLAILGLGTVDEHPITSAYKVPLNTLALPHGRKVLCEGQSGSALAPSANVFSKAPTITGPFYGHNSAWVPLFCHALCGSSWPFQPSGLTEMCARSCRASSRSPFNRSPMRLAWTRVLPPGSPTCRMAACLEALATAATWAESEGWSWRPAQLCCCPGPDFADGGPAVRANMSAASCKEKGEELRSDHVVSGVHVLRSWPCGATWGKD